MALEKMNELINTILKCLPWEVVHENGSDVSGDLRLELGDKSSSIFIDKPTYQARWGHSFHISQSLPQNSFGKDCVAGLEIFLRTTETVPVLNHDCYIQMIESSPWKQTLQFQVNVVQVDKKVHVNDLQTGNSKYRSEIFLLLTSIFDPLRPSLMSEVAYSLSAENLHRYISHQIL